MKKHIQEDFAKSEEDLKKYFQVFERFCKLNNKLTNSRHSYDNLDNFEFHNRVKSILDAMSSKLYGRKLALQIAKEDLNNEWL